MKNVNERLHHAAIGHAVDLAQYGNHVVQRIIALLNRSDAELAARLTTALQAMDTATFTVERLQQLLGLVRQVNTQAYQAVGRELRQVLKEFTAYETGYQLALFNDTLPQIVIERIGVQAANEAQVFDAAMSQPFQGRLLAGWASKLEADRMTRIQETVRQGFVQHQTVHEIVRRIRGTRALRYEDGIVSKSRQELQAVVHTAIGHAAAVARETFFQANADVIASQQWTATLDTKTSEPCRIRDRKPYTLQDHKPIGHKVPWLDGPGRIHFRCRSCAVPKTKTWRQLGIPISEVPPGERASMDGPVDATLSYAEWLMQQSPARQDEVVGPTRGKLMREGKLPFDKLYTDRGIALKLEQLTAQ